MKMISKTRKLLLDNSGETMVEVIVAFTFLTIMLIVFSQGLAWATNSEARASASRNSADQAMTDLQAALAAEAVPGDAARDKATCGVSGISRCTYVIDGQTYVVYQPG